MTSPKEVGKVLALHDHGTHLLNLLMNLVWVGRVVYPKQH